MASCIFVSQTIALQGKIIKETLFVVLCPSKYRRQKLVKKIFLVLPARLISYVVRQKIDKFDPVNQP